MPRRRVIEEEWDEDRTNCGQQRNAANARERARMRVLSKAFCRLKTTLPWVPADTKLSKLDTLRLATSYIAHLRAVLCLDKEDDVEQTNPTVHPLNLTWPFSFQQSPGNGNNGGNAMSNGINHNDASWNENNNHNIISSLPSSPSSRSSEDFNTNINVNNNSSYCNKNSNNNSNNNTIHYHNENSRNHLSDYNYNNNHNHLNQHYNNERHNHSGYYQDSLLQIG